MSTTKTSSKTTVKASTVVVVSSSIKSLITSAASTNAALEAAAKTSEQTIIKLAMQVRKDMQGERDAIRDALAPLFVAAYTAKGKDETYAKQQLSRIVTLAFPGGQKATPKAAKAASEQLDKGITLGMGTNDLLALSRGSAKVGKSEAGPILIPVKSDARGGHNRKTPLETFSFDAGNAITAANVAKLSVEQMAVAIVEAMQACKIKLETIASAFAAATK